jgi:hypothetical protein
MCVCFLDIQLTQIIQVLNIQTTALQWIEQQVAEIDHEIEQAGRLLTQREIERQRMHPSRH